MPRTTALITGASSGIGLELARCAARAGHDLVLVARDGARLEQLAAQWQADHGTHSTVVPLDLTAGDALERLLEALGGRAVDVLVNNAGFGGRGAFAELAPEQALQMIDLNIRALTALTRALLPGMLARRTGGILNVASTAAFQAGPWMAVYYASKAYVLSFSEALHEEVRGRGVRVTCLCPGPTATQFAARAGMQDALLFRLATASAERVARAGWRGFERNRAIVIPGLLNRSIAFSTRLSPRALTRRLAARLQAARAR